MKFTQLVNEKLKLYGEAELPTSEPVSDAALPSPEPPKVATPNEVDALKNDTDSKVSLVIKGSLDMIRDITSILKQTFASELNSTKGGVIDDKLQEIIDVASIVDTKSATPEKLDEIQRKVKELEPTGEV